MRILNCKKNRVLLWASLSTKCVTTAFIAMDAIWAKTVLNALSAAELTVPMLITNILLPNRPPVLPLSTPAQTLVATELLQIRGISASTARCKPLWVTKTTLP